MTARKSFLFALLLLSVRGATSTVHGEVSSKPWRCAVNGGINVFYCYLGVYGVMCQYSNLVREQAEDLQAEGMTTHSALTLAHLSRNHGLPLQVVSLTMDELRSCAKPCIVHLDGKTPEAGAFLLVFGITGNSVYFVNGPSTTIHQLSVEDFRRVWSGIALLPEANRAKKNAVFCGIGLSAGLILPLIMRHGLGGKHENNQ